MSDLVESLLELATLESTDARESDESFDLSKRIALLVDQAQRIARDGRTIVLDTCAGLVIDSAPNLWEVAVRNLLDNALSHSPPASRITVFLEADHDGALLRISNPAEGLDPETVSRCTDRLWRARRSPDDSGHFGLGLSIVEAASKKLVHHFSIRLERGLFLASIARTQEEHSA